MNSIKRFLHRQKWYKNLWSIWYGPWPYHVPVIEGNVYIILGEHPLPDKVCLVIQNSTDIGLSRNLEPWTCSKSSPIEGISTLERARRSGREGGGGACLQHHYFNSTPSIWFVFIIVNELSHSREMMLIIENGYKSVYFIGLSLHQEPWKIFKNSRFPLE